MTRALLTIIGFSSSLIILFVWICKKSIQISTSKLDWCQNECNQKLTFVSVRAWCYLHETQNESHRSGTFWQPLQQMCTLENVDPVTHVPPLLSAMCALCAHVLLFNTQLGDQLGKKLVASPKQSTPLTDQPRDIFFRITIYFKGNWCAFSSIWLTFMKLRKVLLLWDDIVCRK